MGKFQLRGKCEGSGVETKDSAWEISLEAGSDPSFHARPFALCQMALFFPACVPSPPATWAGCPRADERSMRDPSVNTRKMLAVPGLMANSVSTLRAAIQGRIWEAARVSQS